MLFVCLLDFYERNSIPLPCETSGIWRFPPAFSVGCPWMSQCCERVSTGGDAGPQDRGLRAAGHCHGWSRAPFLTIDSSWSFSWDPGPSLCHCFWNYMQRYTSWSLLVFTVALCNPLFGTWFVRERSENSFSLCTVYALWPHLPFLVPQMDGLFSNLFYHFSRVWGQAHWALNSWNLSPLKTKQNCSICLHEVVQ